MGLAMVGTGGFIVGLVIAFREGAATEVIGASAALLILAFLDNRWESIRGRVGNVEFEVMARALQQSEERVESVESEVEALSEQPDLPAQIREQGPVRQARNLDRHRSFSTTLHRRLKVPFRGAPGSIESTDFVFATRL